MSRNISSATKQDIRFIELREEVFRVIKTNKQWRDFTKYMSTYFIPKDIDFNSPKLRHHVPPPTKHYGK